MVSRANDSDIFCTVNGIEYHFSSMSKRARFMRKLEQNRKEVAAKIEKRWRIAVDSDLLADIYLYQMIENHGFYIVTDGGAFEWPGVVKLSGLSVKKNSCGTPFSSSMQKSNVSEAHVQT